MAGLFADQKSFADAIPDESPARIMADYEKERARPGFNLRAFVARHFREEAARLPPFKRPKGQSVASYIHDMWRVLERQPSEQPPYSSLLPLSRPYVVPGGRFREIYYWDSYFTLLGLIQDGRSDLARDMVDNIATLIRRYGHMPNGNRSYYLSRSQPPFFSAMVDLIAAQEGATAYRRYLPALRSEYDFWMAGRQRVKPGHAFRRLVRLKDGTLLNRYWDDRVAPRDESYRQDVETVRKAKRPAAMYRELRAASESGWDFSSRWFKDGKTLLTIQTTAYAPVDLNSLMQHLEATLSRAYASAGDSANARLFAERAKTRADAIRRLMWDNGRGLYTDYLWAEERRSNALTAACVFPLYFDIASPGEAHASALALRRDFLAPGGLATTLVRTGQQWDRPNGWAPLQYLAIEGLKAYGERSLAAEIAKRWIAEDVGSYAASGFLVEKYDVERLPQAGRPTGGSGGEYPLQAGFGWTNGVLAKLMAEYPDAAQAALRRYPAH